MDYCLFIFTMWFISPNVVGQTIEATKLPETTVNTTTTTTVPITTTSTKTTTTATKMPETTVNTTTTTTVPITTTSTKTTTATKLPETTVNTTTTTTVPITTTSTKTTTTATKLPETTVNTTTTTTVPITTTSTKTTTTVRPHCLLGALSGEMNNQSFDAVNINISAVEGGSIIRVYPVSGTLMRNLHTVINEICSVIGWMFAFPERNNGYTYTDGNCTRNATIHYETGEMVTIVQRFNKMNNVELYIDTYIEGTVPKIGSGGYVYIEEYFDMYHQIRPGEIRSDSSREYVIGITRIQYNVSQIITFDTKSAENMVLSNTTVVSVSKISTFVEPGSVRYRMTSKILATPGNNSATLITSSTDVEPGTDTISEYMPFIIGGATTAGASVFIIGISFIAICVWARRTHRLNTAFYLVTQPVEDAEYTEDKETPSYEEVELEITEYDFEELDITEYDFEEPEITDYDFEEPEITEYEFKGDVTIGANKPALCQNASTSTDYLTLASNIYENESTEKL